MIPDYEAITPHELRAINTKMALLIERDRLKHNVIVLLSSGLVALSVHTIIFFLLAIQGGL